MSRHDIPLSASDIQATNVLPAYETSLAWGVTEAELEAALGWTREGLRAPEARVHGASTYQHLEILFARPRYPEFVVAAARAHDVESLGVVGLACLTARDAGAALGCHARFQHLTNRTARYDTSLHDGELRIVEERHGPPRLGSVLMSDFTMLVATRLLTLLVGRAPPVRVMWSRRSDMPRAERALYEELVGADVVTGRPAAGLVLDAALATWPTVRADPRLEAYFRGVLERAAPAPRAEPALLHDVRAAIRAGLLEGPPAIDAVARALGLGARTLQRRLAALDVRFADLVDATRRELAEAYLRDRSLGLAEVAYLLGFSEQASFWRAFRRWHGTTPAAYRASL